MKKILRYFGLIRVKDLNRYYDNEIKFWKESRENLKDPKDIIEENWTYEYAHYKVCVERMKVDLNTNNI